MRIKLLIAILALAVLIGSWVSASTGRKSRLLAATETADRILVAPKSREQHEPFEIVGRELVEQLLQKIEIDESVSVGPCKCHGDTSIDFYNGQEILVSISWAHGSRLKWANGPWKGEAQLTQSSRLAVPLWFKKHGYSRLYDSQ